MVQGLQAKYPGFLASAFTVFEYFLYYIIDSWWFYAGLSQAEDDGLLQFEIAVVGGLQDLQQQFLPNLT